MFVKHIRMTGKLIYIIAASAEFCTYNIKGCNYAFCINQNFRKILQAAYSYDLGAINAQLFFKI